MARSGSTKVAPKHDPDIGIECTARLGCHLEVMGHVPGKLMCDVEISRAVVHYGGRSVEWQRIAETGVLRQTTGAHPSVEPRGHTRNAVAVGDLDAW